MKISPSFLSCDFTKLKSEILSVRSASWLHFDVMDGVFVEAKTYDYHMLEEIKQYSTQFFDCHLMVQDPLKDIKNYAKAGANLITFHYESYPDRVNEVIEEITKYGVKVGISIKPNTPVIELLPYLSKVDLVLVMSVEPGKGGQRFMEESIIKIKLLDELRKKNQDHYLIEVDGGINQSTIQEVKNAGVDVAVVGSFLFNQENRQIWIEKLENE